MKTKKMSFALFKKQYGRLLPDWYLHVMEISVKKLAEGGELICPDPTNTFTIKITR